jgi:hypothetical protein
MNIQARGGGGGVGGVSPRTILGYDPPPHPPPRLIACRKYLATNAAAAVASQYEFHFFVGMCEVMIISALVVINPINVLVTFLQFVVAPSQVVIAAAQVAISFLVPVHFRSDPDNFV